VEARELKLVEARGEREAGGAPSRVTAIALGLLVVAAASLATWLDAAEARRTIDVRQLAEQALQTALRRGAADVEVRDALVELRRTLGWRPLESRTRVVYASLLLGLATDVEEMQLAAFHADRAADLAPVTVPVVRAAALVLASTGEVDRALELTRNMFGYDPRGAAAMLSQIEALVFGVDLDRGLPPAPEAWMAWSRQLETERRRAEAADWRARTLERWPDHVPALARTAAFAFGRGNWDALAELLPPAGRLPDDDRQSARLYAWRAHLSWHSGDREAALADIERALELRDTGPIRTLSGDLFEKMGDSTRARSDWNRALFGTATTSVSSRRGLLLRLARLEDRHGRPAAALRFWKALLALDPEHPEARRRIDDLAGFHR
jgi:tetratricopeptide (TPR) repeat protein